ncbi:MAG: thioredoxin family protein, partial [Myxococcales bacterium]|nr:thioredoxin family protein [Myxococcales bacterium]
HYKSGNMQRLQRKYTAEGVVWLSIISSAPGKQGHSTPDEANRRIGATGAAPTAVLLDHDGHVGRLYGAKVTPHMFVIAPNGVLVYNGAIDDIRSTDVDDIKKAHNYVAAALDALRAGEPVEINQTAPYGCGVKYE